MTTPLDPPRAEIGVIGGSGFYEFLSDAARVSLHTPFGEPSEDVVVGEVQGRSVAFLARHGRGHRFPAHRINYRANLWALRAVGVRQVLAPCAVGSLVGTQGPGSIVVPDQVIDRTWGRPHTVYDDPGAVVHVAFAEPYCPVGRSAVVDSEHGVPVVDGGTLVVVNGPRFSSRAESMWHQRIGGTLIGMTGLPEASIARELALCYTSVCLVTDLDAGVDGGAAVSHGEVLRVFAHNIEVLKQVLVATIARLPVDPGDDVATCACRRALDGLTMPFALPV